MLEGYSALQQTGRRFLFLAFCVIVLLSSIVPMLVPIGPEETGYLASRVIQGEQSVYLATTALVFVLYLFRRFFYLKVVRNVDIAFLSFGLYFSGIATLLVLRGHVGREFMFSLDLWGCVWSSVCLGAGAFLFRPSNERLPQFAFTPRVRQEMLQAANDRLQSINSQVARASAS